MHLAAPSQPFYATDGAGVRRVSLSPEVDLEVIGADSSWSSGEISLSYSVEGLRLISRHGADTLAWVSTTPAEAIASALSAGAVRSHESRTLRILACTMSYVGGVVEVDASRDGRTTMDYEAFRSWLIDGTPLDVESVVQTDSLFQARLRSALGVPEGARIEAWLWTDGHWLDPQSFLIWRSGDEAVLVLGLPAWRGGEAMKVVQLDLDSLNTAHGAMLD